VLQRLHRNATADAPAHSLLAAPVRQRLVYGAYAGGIAALIVLAVWAANLFAEMRLRLTNVLFVPRETSGDVVIVAVDNASLNEYGRAPVLWPRTLHAELIDRLRDARARVIAFDILFTEPADGDEDIAAAVERARRESAAHTRVVMPVVGVQYDQSRSNSAHAAVTHYAHILEPAATLRDAPIALGHANISLDQDGSVRRQLVWICAENDRTYLSFAITTYLTFLRISPDAFDAMVFRENGRLRITSQRSIPVDEQGYMLINYFGVPESETFPTYSYRAVLNGEVDPAAFDGKIVLVGQMNNTGIGELYSVPISFNQTLMPGVEVHANVLETLIQNQPLRAQPRWQQAALIILLAVGAGMLYQAAYWRWYGFAVAVVLSVCAGILGAFLSFTFARIVPSLFDILLALGLPALVVTVQHGALESRQRRRTEILWQSLMIASQQKLNLESSLTFFAADLQCIVPNKYSEIWLWNAHTRQLELAHVTPAPAIRTSHPPTPLLLQAMSTNKICQDRKHVAVPLIWQGQPYGALLCEPRRRLSGWTRELLSMFAGQTAAAIANVRLYSEAQDLSSFKTRMLRMASHDLKNPLSVVFMYVRTVKKALENPGYSPEQLKNFLDRIDNAGHTMLDIINAILDLEQVRRGELITGACDLPALLRTALDQHEAELQQRQHTVETHIPGEFPVLQGDAVQLREAFGNLISNAAKYTPPGGKITISLSKTDSDAQITVQDNGYGIAPEAQARLFEEFYRVQTDQTANIPGTGLGLSLVKAVVEAHGGRVFVQSKEGEGSTFTVELPLVTMLPVTGQTTRMATRLAAEQINTPSPQ